LIRGLSFFSRADYVAANSQTTWRWRGIRIVPIDQQSQMVFRFVVFWQAERYEIFD